MTYAQAVLPEFEQEMASTRKVLERVPDDKLDWKAHPKSNTIGWNAAHLAEIPGYVAPVMTQGEWDIAPIGSEPYRTPHLTSRKEIVELFDKNVASAREILAAAKDEDMPKTWSLLMGGKTMLSMPRAAVIRSLIMNHIIHHRAILTVYLRLNDIPVPGLYGPSGDE